MRFTRENTPHVASLSILLKGERLIPHLGHKNISTHKNTFFCQTKKTNCKPRQPKNYGTLGTRGTDGTTFFRQRHMNRMNHYNSSLSITTSLLNDDVRAQSYWIYSRRSILKKGATRKSATPFI